MFGRKKMYKQGLAHAMQAYEGFAEFSLVFPLLGWYNVVKGAILE